MVVYPFSTYSAFYVGAKEIALSFDDAPLPGSELMSGTEKMTLRHENENTKVLEAKLAELEVFKSS
ncbi:hypothetical protein [Pseudoalteromonas piscicida]|uniref:hypothetical protein n=1 Tax=Pseudoalteromonas piscicida TaxID=43662 RepID=UPI001112416E|nr:hypothetical protein [Pseudoalteromonas piscicida]